MRAEIPGDAHVGLVQAQVDAAGRDEVEVTQIARVDQLLDGDDRWAVEERVTRHQHAPGPAGEPDELRRPPPSSPPAASRRTRACRTRVPCEARSKWVDTGVAITTASMRSSASDVEVRARRLDERIAALEELEPLGALVADGDHFKSVDLDEVAEQVRPPVAETDDGDAQWSAHRVALGRNTCTGVCRSSSTSRPNDQLRA